MAPVEPFDLIIFGGTGDLAMHKLLPALYRRFNSGQLPPGSRILGVAPESQSADAYRNAVAQALVRAAPDVDHDALIRFIAQLGYQMLDAHSGTGWPELASACVASDPRLRMFYLATSPKLYAEICARLRQHGIKGAHSRVVVEKPIGHDLASARAINAAIGSVFSEDQTFRIDHYLGKETVQNLMVLRFGNTLFEPLWNAGHIERVQITVAETIGVEGRGAFYDATGALRDMVQNHLLQLLCLVAMEPLSSLQAEAVRTEKLKVLRALKPIDAGNAARLTLRGQYRAGVSAAMAVPSYLQDVGKPVSTTETFVALRAEVGNWRWAGVPFYLCTGKRLAQRVSEIIVSFRPVPHSIFSGSGAPAMPNQLVLRLQPDESVKLWLMVKYPNVDDLRLRPVALNMSFAEAFGGNPPDAYERLILDVARGDLTLFMHRDEVEAAWQWIDPIVHAWAHAADSPQPYAAGTLGPNAATGFLGGETLSAD
ncbi:MAG TPA: glucose-6-phosphate dehydrogenase [Gammaproteobacteria bacterium]|nr:glucose-6-phosphate dehydrogenase [Gammaproteobacteria bacterium]